MKVRFEPFQEGHLPLLQAWLKAPHVKQFWQEPGTFGIDQFIGIPEMVGKGLGPKVIKSFLEMLYTREAVKVVIVDPEPSNIRAIKAYEKSGFIQLGEISTPNGKAILMRLRDAGQPNTE